MTRANLVLLHGVGPGPEAFADVAALLSTDHRVLRPERPWSAGTAPSLDDQAAGVAAAMVAADMCPATVVGVSGGATLGLRLAMLFPGVVDRLLVHEPLVGSHAPDLAARFGAWGQRVASGDDAEVVAFVRSVMSLATWAKLGDASRARVLDTLDRVRAELPVFAAFDPRADDLALLRRIPLLTTVGSRSGSDRLDAAAVLTALAGASTAVIDGAANLPHVDVPAVFADVIRSFAGTRAAATC